MEQPDTSAAPASSAGSGMRIAARGHIPPGRPRPGQSDPSAHAVGQGNTRNGTREASIASAQRSDSVRTKTVNPKAPS